jgi:sphingolipid delta-4 desaturase
MNETATHKEKKATRQDKPFYWHNERRSSILKTHPEVKQLIGNDSLLLLQVLLLPAINVFCLYLSSRINLGTWLGWLEILALTAVVGACVRMRIFNIMHELCHGTVHILFSGKLKSIALMLVQYPAWGSVYPYYRWFHISHHSELGTQSVEESWRLARLFGKADGDRLIPLDLYASKKTERGTELESPPMTSTPLQRFFRYGLIIPLGRGLILPVVIMLRLPGDLLRFARNSKKVSAEFRSNILNSFADRCLWILSVVLATVVFGWSALLFLVLSQCLYQGLLFHPCLAAWLAAHKSHDRRTGCQPTTSIYGPVMTYFCGGVNFHTEHHDFPSIPATRLAALNKIASSYYNDIPKYTGAIDLYRDLLGSGDKQWVYGCQDQGQGVEIDSTQVDIQMNAPA